MSRDSEATPLPQLSETNLRRTRIADLVRERQQAADAEKEATKIKKTISDTILALLIKHNTPGAIVLGYRVKQAEGTGAPRTDLDVLKQEMLKHLPPKTVTAIIDKATTPGSPYTYLSVRALTDAA